MVFGAKPEAVEAEPTRAVPAVVAVAVEVVDEAAEDGSTSCCSMSFSFVIVILHLSKSVDVDLSIFCEKARCNYLGSLFPTCFSQKKI